LCRDVFGWQWGFVWSVGRDGVLWSLEGGNDALTTLAAMAVMAAAASRVTPTAARADHGTQTP